MAAKINQGETHGARTVPPACPPAGAAPAPAAAARPPLPARSGWQAGGVRARVGRCVGPPPGEAAAEARLRAEGLHPRAWGNPPGDTYGWHAHGYDKVLYCVTGGITFHLGEGEDVVLGAGDRLEIPPGTQHAATVGPDGVRCVEAPR